MLVNVYIGISPLQTTLVQMAIPIHWLSFRKKQIWFVGHVFLSLESVVICTVYNSVVVII